MTVFFILCLILKLGSSADASAQMADLSPNQVIANFSYFDQMPASAELILLSNWIQETVDNQNLPYLVIDKLHAQLLLFHGNGELAGTTPALLGMALGDKLALKTAQQALVNIKPTDRITPTGRFAVEFGHDLHGQDILWIDYDAAISLHRLFEGNAKERRRERLQTPSSSDNRISFGCINVSKEFYEKTIRHFFLKRPVLPTSCPNKMPYNFHSSSGS